MKHSQGASQSSFVHKSLYDKLQDILCCRTLPNYYKRLDDTLEKKMMEIKRNPSRNINFKSIDSIIMKFPQFREGLKEIREIFEQYDEDSNGTIDNEELKKCLHAFEFSISDEEIDDLFSYCDMDENEGIQFKEFIVLVCLIYLLTDAPTSPNTKLKMCSPKIEATFNTIIEVFLFLDKNGVGKLKKKDVVKALNEASPREKSPSHITRSRFREMDWDKNGKVSFKEFLFSFIGWVGIDCDDEDHEE
ncbi:Calcium-binding EF-hand family protein [Perilla frutescens var. hirtella]|uniref:Calcium-binding EF-hand family protein n=1 Tax=Perilla frutescens var. hirtella TaxID=608512 RepID=A0AAD4JK42_PERFH|nr:Calcium-binding EF-hand family protein [Perilla frutescens var. frutescens]KAH6786775.1 Calcium-binding EF-hand family protein [Perilla frutescens var. hirtella]KAH6834784.1 Calcium-binding EF-hand family protein [Perilla frutescens var. hirtella]